MKANIDGYEISIDTIPTLPDSIVAAIDQHLRSKAVFALYQDEMNYTIFWPESFQRISYEDGVETANEKARDGEAYLQMIAWTAMFQKNILKAEALKKIITL